jgi:hypothetical protein
MRPHPGHSRCEGSSPGFLLVQPVFVLKESQRGLVENPARDVLDAAPVEADAAADPEAAVAARANRPLELEHEPAAEREAKLAAVTHVAEDAHNELHSLMGGRPALSWSVPGVVRDAPGAPARGIQSRGGSYPTRG